MNTRRQIRTTIFVFLISSIIAFASSSFGTTTTLYVSPTGSDTNSGTSAKPFATLTRARDAIRGIKGGGKLQNPVSVVVREGTYFLTKPLEFTSADSGTSKSLITYSAAAGETPIISGGVRVSNWRKFDNQLWVAAIPFVASQTEPFTQLFVNGTRRTRARTPNAGSYFYSRRLDLTTETYPRCTALTFRPGDIGEWINGSGAQVVLFANWINSYNNVQKADFTRNKISFTLPHGYFYPGPEIRYYVENVFEALDEPGEWFVDYDSKMQFYYYPVAGENLTSATVIAPVIPSSIVVVKGDPGKGEFVENLVFRGLSFQYSEADLSLDYPHSQQGAHTQQGAFFAVGLRNSVIENCEFAHLGEHGVSLREGCSSVTIRQCHIHDMGGGGVYLSGDVPATTTNNYLTLHNKVDDNFIHDGGIIYRAGCGVYMGGSASYNQITHNEICDLSWVGVHVGWSWTGLAPTFTHHNEVGFNHISYIGNGVLSDMGGIYTLGVSPGTRLHNNWIHNVTRFERGTQGYGGWGIYLDAGSSEIRIENNVVHDIRDGGLHLHDYDYPHGDVVTNNIFAYATDTELIRNNNQDTSTGIHVALDRNIVYETTGHTYGGSWNAGSKFTTDYNCFWNATTQTLDFFGKTFEAWKAEGRDQHSIIADPGFVDPEKRDFHLRPNSPALTIGFQPIDFTQAGLYGSADWTNLPKGITHRTFEAASPPDPVTLNETFESDEIGKPPDNGTIVEEKQPAVVRVTNEYAASGTQCLKFTDGPGQQYIYNPHFFYSFTFPTGMLRGAFDLRLESGVIFDHEWRDWRKDPYDGGPCLIVQHDGSLVVNGATLTTLPHQQWVHFEILCGTGAKANGRWQLTVRVAGQQPQTFANLVCSPKFQQLTYIGFISLATDTSVFYVDNIVLDKADLSLKNWNLFQ